MADRDLQATDPNLRASRYEDTPLVVDGLMYTVTPLGMVAALDAGGAVSNGSGRGPCAVDAQPASHSTPTPRAVRQTRLTGARYR